MGKASRKKKQAKKPTTITNSSDTSTNSPDTSANTSSAAQTSVAATPSPKTKKTPKRGRRVQKKTNYTPWIIGAVVLAGVILFPQLQSQYKLRTATGEFAQLIREGHSEVGRLQTKHRDLGRSHVPFGSNIKYNSSPATTGPHYGSWINPGYYIDEQEERQLVHSLEHGHVVAYYGEDIADEDKDKLIEWTGDFRNTWGGFVVTPYEDLGEGIILNAWRTTIRLDKFDPAITAAFIDRYRGRGPENPIR